MYYAILRSLVDRDHMSDRFENINLNIAKSEARKNYIEKYPHDDLSKTEYITGTVKHNQIV